jgi:hypothetical protein
VKKKDYFNSLLIVLTIFAIGAILIIWPSRRYLEAVTAQIRAGRGWMPMLVGIAYVVGFFVTRIVEDSFDAIFGKPPFSEIGEEDKGQKKHPLWVDRMLTPIGYSLFFARVVLIVGAIVLLAQLGWWVVGK